MQFNVIAEIESGKTPYTLIKPEEFKTPDGTTNEVMDQVLAEVYNQWPIRIEHYEAAYMRAQVSKEFMRHFFHANKSFLDSDDAKVGIVSHSMFLRCLSAEGFDPENKKLINATDMKNCEIFPCINYKF